ncbi:M3 family metallopeptidase, partial [Helicobacter pylori]
FSPEFHKIASKAIKEGWVDSHPKDFKQGGAFSHGGVPSAHPYVLLNYTGNRRDAFTIAHEFGHMIHQELSKKQGVLNMDTPLTTAETASVFSEMLFFEHLKKGLKSDELLFMLAGKLEDIFSTLFRQVVMTNFERRIHEIDEELDTKDFDRIWFEENQRMFEKSVKLTKNYHLWWSYIPHFIHSPFYCYA